MDNPASSPEPSAAPRLSFYSRFTQPGAVATAWIVGVLSAAFGVYTYFVSQAYRELVFYSASVVGEIVKSGQTSGLSVNFNGQPIKGDISVTQVAIWNAGKLAIKKENILEPATISFPKPVRILEVSLRTQTRKLCGVQLDLSKQDEGVVGVSWNILEQNDGGLIQIVFVGSSSLKPAFGAQIEKPNKLIFPADEERRFNQAFIWVLLIAMALFGGAIFFGIRRPENGAYFLFLFIVIFLVLPFLARLIRPRDDQSVPKEIWPFPPRVVHGDG